MAHEVERFSSVEETSAVLGISKSLTKRLVYEGKLLSVRIGDRRLIPASALRDFQRRLMEEAEQERAGAA